ncbi:NUDIX domain-containing protein [Actinomyces sp. 2119]|uniref:NUDIX hydrolase n=1 Tax=Actinomyces sp. 2119 TaxID=2321393 RepID=UPI000E6D1BE4|nr:NUDIX domain-containing protein [Actinomyces sp. 2119]RJF41174.1 NUDIX domain-containing protein [Actinomyces sp. 2119]
MATPDFILALREKIGHDLLWLPGVSIVVVDDDERVLLGRRSDNGHWAVVSGIPDPGEQPGAAARRECLEETGVEAEILGVASVSAGAPMAFPNGDRCAFMDMTFVARPAPGSAPARVADDESTQVGWFAPDALPSPLLGTTPGRLQAALEWLADPASGARFQ